MYPSSAEILRASLGLPESSYKQPFLRRRVEEDEEFAPQFKSSIILEAEMVAYSERTKCIDGEDLPLVLA